MPEHETTVALYKVFGLAAEQQIPIKVLPLQNICLENLHFVYRDAVSWWWNPFVIQFI
jgi:hypothetical protein